jgi:hypothetical protein
MPDLLLLEDRHIQEMLRDPRYAALPCIAGVAASLDQQLLACGRCTGKKKRMYSQTITNIKNCLTSLRGSQLNQLKSLLGASKLRLFKRNSKGHRVQVTF